MPNWQKVEAMRGARPDKQVVTICARRTGAANPVLMLTIGSSVARAMGWNPGRAEVEVDPNERLLRIRPTTGRGTCTMSGRKDAGMLAMQVRGCGDLEPRAYEPCEIAAEDGWLVLRIPAWAARALERRPSALPTSLPAIGNPRHSEERARIMRARYEREGVTRPLMVALRAANPTLPEFDPRTLREYAHELGLVFNGQARAA